MAKIIKPSGASIVVVDGLEWFVWDGYANAGGGVAWYAQWKYALPVRPARGGVCPAGHAIKLESTEEERGYYFPKKDVALKRIRSAIKDYMAENDLEIASQAANKLMIKIM